MPGANERALEKTKTIDADALILDLEDSVAPDAKDAARERVCAAVKTGGYGRRELVIRINALDTPWGVSDLVAAAQTACDAVLIPKVSDPTHILHAASSLTGGTRLWAMMETPLAILSARDIAAAARDPAARLDCFVLGTNDLVKDIRAKQSADRMALLPSLATVILAARAFGLDVIDGVYNDFKDEPGFRAECEQGRLLGMDGKTLIHPSQVELCNTIFSPAPDEIAWAAKIVAAFDLPGNAGKGVITVDGKMVERLHLDMAMRTLAIARSVGA
ncbi:CoA ester lyase [soil metagenome]